MCVCVCAGGGGGGGEVRACLLVCVCKNDVYRQTRLFTSDCLTQGVLKVKEMYSNTAILLIHDRILVSYNFLNLEKQAL